MTAHRLCDKLCCRGCLPLTIASSFARRHKRNLQLSRHQSMGVADEMQPFYIGGQEAHSASASGLLWDIDNWVYQTAENERFRYRRKYEMGKLPMSSVPGASRWRYRPADLRRGRAEAPRTMISSPASICPISFKASAH